MIAAFSTDAGPARPQDFAKPSPPATKLKPVPAMASHHRSDVELAAVGGVGCVAVRRGFVATCAEQLNECVRQLLWLDGRALAPALALDSKPGWKAYLLQFKSLATQPSLSNFGQYVANVSFVAAVLKDFFHASANSVAKLTPDSLWMLLEYFRWKHGDEAIDRLVDTTGLMRPAAIATLPAAFFSSLRLADCKQIVRRLGASAARLNLRMPKGSYNPMRTAVLDHVQDGCDEMLGAPLFCQLDSLQTLKTNSYQDIYKKVFSAPDLIAQIDPQLIRQMDRSAWLPGPGQEFAINPEALSCFSAPQLWAIPADALDANLLAAPGVKTVFDAIPVGRRGEVNTQYWVQDPARIGKLNPAERQKLLHAYVHLLPARVIAAFSANDLLNYFLDPARPKGDDARLIDELTPVQLKALSCCGPDRAASLRRLAREPGAAR